MFVLSSLSTSVLAKKSFLKLRFYEKEFDS